MTITNSTQAVSCYGFNGSNPQKMEVNTSGHMKVNVENALSINTAGLATDTLQTSGNSSLTSMDGKITACNTGAVVVASGSMSVSNFPATQAVSAVALPLPTGAGTSALQTAGNASLTSVDGKITACDTGAVVVSNITTCDTGNIAGSVSVSNFPATQAVSAAALPLPTGAGTSALQTAGNASVASMDGKVTACNTGAVVVASGTLSVSNFPATQNVKINDVLTAGTYENIIAGTSLAPAAETGDIDVSNMKHINILYQDTLTSSFDGLNVLASGDSGTNYNIMQQLYPTVSGSIRYASLSINVSGLTNLKLKNTSSTATYTVVSASGFGSL